jgi:copper oxidase (laccase) domain-containing protein
VHSGWKGTGIVLEALRAMNARYGTRPADVEVMVGPGIGPCCYTVPAERARAFEAEFGPGSVARIGGQARLDLRAANVALLDAVGVAVITVVSNCTACTPALGSFRRQGQRDYVLMLAWAARV